ncbi:MAG: hypothetical protein DDT20_01187 [Firmicutes bacterium]|nr:hypothetical protein [Bacillota bacterium]
MTQVAMYNVSYILANSRADGEMDKEYWRQMGWLETRAHCLVPEVRLGLKQIVGGLVRLVAAKIF